MDILSGIRKGTLALAFATAAAVGAKYVQNNFLQQQEKKESSVLLQDRLALSEKWNSWLCKTHEAMESQENRECFSEFVEQIHLSPESTLHSKVFKVNAYVNKTIAYEKDGTSDQNADYWATPAEVIQRKKGDCEDVALLKYYMLRQLGVADSQIALVLVDTKEAKPDTAHMNVIPDHAMLAVSLTGEVLPQTLSAENVFFLNNNTDGSIYLREDIAFPITNLARESASWTIGDISDLHGSWISTKSADVQLQAVNLEKALSPSLLSPLR